MWYRRRNHNGPLQFHVKSTETFTNCKLELVHETEMMTRFRPIPVYFHRNKPPMTYTTQIKDDNVMSFHITVSQVTHMGLGFCLYLILESGTNILSAPFWVKDRLPPIVPVGSSWSETIRIIRQLEWCLSTESHVFFCPMCRHSQHVGHPPDCELHSLLRRHQPKFNKKMIF
jgi:hypothetical protein